MCGQLRSIGSEVRRQHVGGHADQAEDLLSCLLHQPVDLGHHVTYSLVLSAVSCGQCDCWFVIVIKRRRLDLVKIELCHDTTVVDHVLGALHDSPDLSLRAFYCTWIDTYLLIRTWYRSMHTGICRLPYIAPCYYGQDQRSWLERQREMRRQVRWVRYYTMKIDRNSCKKNSNRCRE